jgi:hypothetical protein
MMSMSANFRRSWAKNFSKNGEKAPRLLDGEPISCRAASPGLLLVVADVLELRVDHIVLGRFRRAGARGLGLLRLVHRLAELH